MSRSEKVQQLESLGFNIGTLSDAMPDDLIDAILQSLQGKQAAAENHSEEDDAPALTKEQKLELLQALAEDEEVRAALGDDEDDEDEEPVQHSDFAEQAEHADAIVAEIRQRGTSRKEKLEYFAEHWGAERAASMMSMDDDSIDWQMAYLIQQDAALPKAELEKVTKFAEEHGTDPRWTASQEAQTRFERMNLSPEKVSAAKDNAIKMGKEHGMTPAEALDYFQLA